MKKADLSMGELVKILLAIVVLLILVYIVLYLRGPEGEKIAFFKSLFRGVG